ncbi:hypothetical protein V5O48_019391, partial [Marasmius crinis-equi]
MSSNAVNSTLETRALPAKNNSLSNPNREHKAHTPAQLVDFMRAAPLGTKATKDFAIRGRILSVKPTCEDIKERLLSTKRAQSEAEMKKDYLKATGVKSRNTESKNKDAKNDNE